MRRREFMALAGGAAAWPLATHAQQPPMPVIGFLNSGSLHAFATLLGAFRDGLSEQGYVERSNVWIDYRWADGHYDDLDALAAELVRNRVGVIAATGGTPSAKAAVKATTTIPIVFVVGFDPVKLGLVASLNDPGGNATGASLFTTELASKRLELLYSLIPGSSTVATLVNPRSGSSEVETRDTSAVARHSERPLIVLRASTETEIGSAFASAVEQRVGAIVVSADPFFTTRREQVVALAAHHAMPVVYPLRQYVDAGGLMTYGPELEWAYRRIGHYAGRILKGARPSELPVELPTKFKLVINLKTANALGLTIPDTLLARADEVIE